MNMAGVFPIRSYSSNCVERIIDFSLKIQRERCGLASVSLGNRASRTGGCEFRPVRINFVRREGDQWEKLEI